MKINLGVIVIGAVLLILAGLYTTGNLYTILDIEEPMPDLVRDTLVYKWHDADAINHIGAHYFSCSNIPKMYSEHSDFCYNPDGTMKHAEGVKVYKWVESGLTDGSDGDIVRTTGLYSDYYIDNQDSCIIEGFTMQKCLEHKFSYPMGEYDLVISHKDDLQSETLIEDCLGTGTVVDGNKIKCGSYGKPNVGISIDKEGWKVTPDGSAIDHVVCDYSSSNGVCGYSPTQVLHMRSAQFTEDFMSGDDISIEVMAYYEGAPLTSALVHGELRKDNVVFAHTSGLTGVDGLVTLDFINPQALGDVYFFASTTYRLTPYSTTGTYMFFDTRPVTAIPSTTSYEQYTDRIIEFTVTIKDENGIGIPSYKLTNMQDISTITGENVNNIEITPGGDGIFRIKNAVTGPGRFNGMIKFDYNTITFFSSPILIDVIQPDIAYSMTGFGSPPTMWEDNLIEMHFTSTSYIDEPIDPERLTVTVIYPDGSSTDIITKELMNRTEPGHYTFEYEFTQPQQYTFYIRPERIGYETIEHEKLVIVTAAINPDPTPEPFPTPVPPPGPRWDEIIFTFILENKGIITSISIIVIVILFGAGIIKKRGLL